MAQNTHTSQDAAVVVKGSGTIYGAPDVAILTLGVNANDRSLEEALNDANSRVSDIYDTLTSKGLEQDAIRTTSFNIYPDERYDRNGNPSGVTYRVENILTVRVTDLNTVGEILTASINAGANRVQSVQYDILDKTSMQQEARRLAVENAITKAEELAGLASVTLGSVTNIVEVDSNSYYPPSPSFGAEVMMMSADRVSADVPVSGGQLSVSVTVQIGFELE